MKSSMVMPVSALMGLPEIMEYVRNALLHHNQLLTNPDVFVLKAMH
jgi:hypothetical protein